MARKASQQYIERNSGVYPISNLEVALNSSAKRSKNLEEINDTENIPVEIIDNRREIDDLSDAELKELEKELEQYDKDMWRHLDCLQKYKHIGEEIPKDVPFTEYFGYIIRNFRNPKPRKEWTVRDYKVDAAKEARKKAAFIIKDHGYKEPLTDRQKRVMERIRNGTDFHIFNSMEEIRKRFE